MPKLTISVPKYRLHKASGQAVVELNRRTIYLGEHGTAASKSHYNQLVAEWQVAGRQLAASMCTSNSTHSSPTIAAIIDGYTDFAEGYYVKNGAQTTTLQHIKDALKPLAQIYHATPAKDFGPLALKAVREHMVNRGRWCRKTVNKAVAIICRMFKWASENELVPASAFHALKTVSGLRKGRSKAREMAPVKPIPTAYVEAVLSHVSGPVRAMIEVQLLTGMRPGEIVLMRGCDLDTSGKVWTYSPQSHKTEHHDKDRPISIGPKAQAIVRKFLKPDIGAYLFDPVEAERDRRAEQRRTRATPMNEGNRPGSNRKPKPRWQPGDHYTVASYRRAIDRGCDEAFPAPDHLARLQVQGTLHLRWETDKEWKTRLGEKHWRELREWQTSHRWAPNRLRHTAATFIRKEFGLDAARAILGHSSPAVTEVYAELDRDKATEVMARIG
jgi:integrase